MGHVVTLKTEPVSRSYAAAVAACVAERLKTLGHPADMVTPGALDALMEHAGGSIPRLRAALASTIFLASTEDAPHIERDHVERAVENLGVTPQLTADSGYAPSARRRRGAPWAIPAAAALLVAVTAASVMLLASHGKTETPTPTPTPPVVAEAPTVQPAPAAVAIVPDQTKTAKSATLAVAAPAPASAPAPMPEAIAVPDLPLPPGAKPIGPTSVAPPPTIAAQPAAPLTVVVLRYRQGDPWALDKLSAASDSLRQAGFSRIYAYPWRGRQPAAPVGYFFPGDLPAAQAVASVFSRARLLGGARRHADIHVLAERRPSTTPHPPGTIEAILP